MSEIRLRWKALSYGYSAGAYQVRRNTRGNFSVWFAEADGLRLVNQECDTLTGAKSLAQHDQDNRLAQFGKTLDKLIHGERV